MTTKLENLIYAMLAENTGAHLLDSGGAYGRGWQRNAKMTIEDFKQSPSATLHVSNFADDNGATKWDCYPTVSLFHAMANTLELDDFCNQFNALPCLDWDGDYYGVSQSQSEWLSDNEFTAKGEGFNTYNDGDNVLSQILQGQLMDRDQETYLLLQIHNGCDARGGYTDAKLFKLNSEETIYNLLGGACSFWVDDKTLDWRGEWINQDGSCASDSEVAAFCEKIGAGTHNGDAYFSY